MEHINPTLNPTPKPTYTILDTTDYRALCAELLAALENAIGVIYHEDGTQHISTADAVITRADVALHQAEGTLSYGMGPGTDGMGDLVRIEPSSFVVKSKLLHGLLKFAQEMYDEGYDQGCYEATGGQ